MVRIKEEEEEEEDKQLIPWQVRKSLYKSEVKSCQRTRLHPYPNPTWESHLTQGRATQHGLSLGTGLACYFTSYLLFRRIPPIAIAEYRKIECR